MNRTHSPLGGRTSMFGGASRPSSRFTPGRLLGAAGRATLSSELAFDPLEQRQMLFALAGPLDGTRVAQQDFAYFLPYLGGTLTAGTVPAWVANAKHDYTFDFQGGGGVTPLPSGTDLPPADAAQPPVPNLRIEHTGFGNVPAAFPQLGFVGTGATDEDGEITNLAVTGARTVTFSRPSTIGTSLSVMFAFDFYVILPGELRGTAPNQVAVPATETFVAANIRIQIFNKGVLLNDLQVTQTAVPGTTNPALTDIRLERNGVIRDFDQVRFSAIGAGDTFSILRVTTEEPPGRFTTYAEQHSFAGRIQFAGPANGLPDPGAALHPDAPIGRTTQELFDTDAGALNRRLTAPTTFASGVRLTSTNYNAGNAPQVIAGPGGGNDRVLSFGLATNQTFSFSFLDAQGVAKPMTAFSFAVPNGGSTADLGVGTQIELLRFGQVVRTYTDADLRPVNPGDQAVRFANGVNANQDLYILNTTTGTPGFDILNTYPTIAGLGAAFDEVRISRTGGAGTDTGGIQIDRVSPYAPSMVEFFDLYGRPARPTLQADHPDTVDARAPIDFNDDGVPDYNDGIGRVIISNADATTNVTMYGGDSHFDTTQGTWVFDPITTTIGNFNDMETAGFGFTFDPAGSGKAVGLANGPGSIVIGSPFVRDNTSPQAYHGVDVTIPNFPAVPASLPFHFNGTLAANFGDGTPITPFDFPLTLASDFSNAFTGISSPTGTAVGAVTVHGAVLGQNNFGSSVVSLTVGTLLGSVRVNGDISFLTSANDAGEYFVRPQNAAPPDDARGLNDVGSTINILRAAGNMYFGSRNSARITVFNDVNNASLGRNSYISYGEREAIPGFGPGVQNPEQVWNGAVLGATNTANGGGQPMLFGQRGFRNDVISNAEFIGNPGSFTTVSGSLGNFNDLQTVEDQFDYYAFAAAAGRTITFDAIFTIGGPTGQNGDTAEAYIVDAQGRVMANHQAPIVSPNRIPGTQGAVRFTFTPQNDDVYYLVVTTATDGNATSTQAYTVSVSGMAPTGAGSVTFVGNSTNFLEIRTSLGFLNSGSGIVGDDGTASALGNTAIDTIDTPDDFLEPHGLTFQVQGNLYSAVFGSDIEGGTYAITGNLGSFRVGNFHGNRGNVVDPLAALPQGDLVSVVLDVGGRIATIEVLGDVGNRRDVYHTTGAAPNGNVAIRSGLSGGDGSIGSFRVAGLVVGDVTSITVFGANSVFTDFTIIGGFALGVPTIAFPDGGRPGNIGTPAVPVSRPGIPPQVDGFQTPLLFDVPLVLTASSGVVYTIRIAGGVSSRASGGVVHIVPIVGSPGGVLTRIDVTLAGGANLLISTNTPGKLDIGTIAITTAPGGGTGTPRTSNVSFGGNGEIDVGYLSQFAQAGAANLGTINNATVGGDLFIAEVQGVNNVIVRGNLGRTEDATRRGLDRGAGALGFLIDPQFLGAGWDGTFDPTDAPTGNGNPSVEIGGLMDRDLRGLHVLTGGVASIVVGGTVGDVILDGGGTLTSLVANSDGVTGSTGFDGIVGNIYATHILNINIGQGLASTGDSGNPSASIAAIGTIGSITGNVGATIINSLIVAGNGVAPPRGFQSGIGSISITGGLIDGAYIGVATGQSWWRSAKLTNPRVLQPGDVPEPAGIVRSINLTRTPLFRSQVFGTDIGTILITGAAFDATSLNATQTIGQIRADRFINSTRDGEPLEFRATQIFAGISIAGITATREISDLIVIANGSLTNGITASTITRLDAEVRQRIGPITTTGDIRSSTFSVGNLASVSTGGDLRSSTFAVAGPVNSIRSSGEITNTSVTSTGPDGRILSISAVGNITGSFTASGPISSITSTRGSISGSVATTDATDGDLASINAGGDLGVTFSIARNITSLRSGGNIGRPQTAGGARDVIDVGGTIGTITATGQLYADVRGGSTIASITTGRVSALPTNDLVGDGTITAYGRIGSIAVTGDFNGSIISFSGGIGSVRITNGSFRIGNDDDANGVISAGERNRIEAHDGNIDSVAIANGSLFGNVIATDGDIRSISVTGTGPFGRIGIDPSLSTTGVVTGDALRRQLPPGTPSTAGFGGTTAFDGPSIRAGHDVVSVVSSAGMFEVGIYAARNVTTVSSGGGINTDALGTVNGASFIAAGDTVSTVTARGSTRGLAIVAGVASLGADDRVGGAAANADTLRAGKVTSVTITGASDTVTVTAGVNAGADGLYNTADAGETAVPGLSTVGAVTVTGTVAATSVLADTNAGTGTAAVTRSTGALPADARTFTGSTATFTQILAAGLDITTTSGETARAIFTGAGQAFWDSANNRIVLISSTLASTLRVSVTGATTTLTNFGVVSNDDASLGSLVIAGQLRSATASDTVDRNSRVFVDGNVSTLTVGNTVITADAGLAGSGILFVGGDLTSATVGTVGTLAAPAAANQFRLEVGGALAAATANGDFGTSSVSRIDAVNLGSLTVNGALRGVVSITRDIASVRATGAMNGGRVRAGGNITSVTAAGASNLARISAGGNLQSVVFSSDVSDTTIYAGTDLGTDGTFGGVGSAADSTTNGNIGSVSVTGNFIRSDVSAGAARGTDGFLNTSDDVVADGLSTLASVRITGQQVGSSVLSQRYAVLSNGSITSATVAGQPVGTGFNFSKVNLLNRPTPILITDVTVFQRAPRQFTGRIFLNQNIDASTMATSLSVSEVRGVGNLISLVPLVNGVDYNLRYDAPSRSIFVEFVEAVGTRDLVGNTPGAQAGPGIFRFTLDAATFRGATVGARLDGNSDGNIGGDSDDYSEDVIVGDAGDRTTSGRAFQTATTAVDLYGPVSLDVLMDRNNTANGLADTNRAYSVRGVLGDHPDSNVGAFGAGGDIDVFTLTLRAGQIFRLGALTGSASGADVAILDSQANPIFRSQTGPVSVTSLQPLGSQDPADTTTSFLVRVSGTYTIAILPSAASLVQFNPFGTTDLTSAAAAAGGSTNSGTTGDYALSLRVDDDLDSGFAAGLPAQDANILIGNVPVPNDFRGADTTFATFDDVQTIPGADVNPANPQFIFQLQAGANNILNGNAASDDVIVGSNGAGVFATRTAGVDGTFGTGDDVLTVTRTVLAGAAPVDPDGAGAQQAVPVPNDFRGVDNTFNTADDITSVTRTATAGPNFTYTLLAGNDGVRGTADDLVSGSNGEGIVSTRAAGVDNAFDTGDDVIKLLTDSGDGTNVVNATVTPSNFAGVDNTLGTADDLASITIGGFTFTLSKGTNNRFDGNGTAQVRSDDIVTGSNTPASGAARIVSTRTAGADGRFGTTDDVFTSTADGAIGTPGTAGVPFNGQADIDIYQLNNGLPITPGTRVRATLKLSEIGGNLGRLQPVLETLGDVVTYRVIDNRGLVQFALFDTSLATDISNASLIAAPTGVMGSTARTPATINDGSTRYGYDANGDFFMEFAIPGRVDNAAAAGTFALYLQGVVRSDYQLEIVTSGTAALPVGAQTQNVLIEARGGAFDWLEANPYRSTTVAGFDPGASGFSGQLGAGNLTPTDFFVTQIVSQLQAMFTAAGVTITVSSNAADFEGQDFSTVFLSGSEPPVGFVNNGTFGSSQHVDIFNADHNDSAVVYLSQFNNLGNSPDSLGAANLINQITAGVGRRIGELVGVRITTSTGAGATTDVLAANSPTLTLPNGGVYRFSNASLPLSGTGDGLASTQFFLGNQRSLQLLQRIFGV